MASILEQMNLYYIIAFEDFFASDTSFKSQILPVRNFFFYSNFPHKSLVLISAGDGNQDVWDAY